MNWYLTVWELSCEGDEEEEVDEDDINGADGIDNNDINEGREDGITSINVK